MKIDEFYSKITDKIKIDYYKVYYDGNLNIYNDCKIVSINNEFCFAISTEEYNNFRQTTSIDDFVFNLIKEKITIDQDIYKLHLDEIFSYSNEILIEYLISILKMKYMAALNFGTCNHFLCGREDFIHINQSHLRKIEYAIFEKYPDNDYEYQGNFRICKVGDSYSEEIYDKILERSCCGIISDEIIIDGIEYKYGFDYGH